MEFIIGFISELLLEAIFFIPSLIIRWLIGKDSEPDHPQRHPRKPNDGTWNIIDYIRATMICTLLAVMVLFIVSVIWSGIKHPAPR